ncbi:MAG: serine hydrolase domain-containing protein [Verrucomicrobiota bacterium]
MRLHHLSACFAVTALSVLGLKAAASAAGPALPGVGEAMREMVVKNEITGAVTMVVSRDKVLHLESTGLADAAADKPMSPETVFWIASMTKPVTGAAVLMLQDEGKLKVSDPVAK